MPFDYVPGTNIEVPEIEYKDKINLPKDKSALIIVDMQNDFVREGGSLYVPAAEGTVNNIRSLAKSARSNGVKVFYTQDTHLKDDREFDIWPLHCVEGTEGWKIINELTPEKDDMVFRKNRYDGFYNTAMEHYLSHVYDIKHLVIVGTVANICVLHTAASAGLRWYDIVVPANGISAQTEFDQAATLRQVSTLYAGEAVKSVNDIEFG